MGGMMRFKWLVLAWLIPFMAHGAEFKYSYKSNCDCSGNLSNVQCDLEQSASFNLFRLFKLTNESTISFDVNKRMTGNINLSYLKKDNTSVIETKMMIDNLSHTPILLEYELKLITKEGKADTIKGLLQVEKGKNQTFNLQDILLSEKAAKQIYYYELKINAKSE